MSKRTNQIYFFKRRVKIFSSWLIFLFFISCNNQQAIQTKKISQSNLLNPKVGYQFHLVSSQPGEPITFKVAEVKIAEILLLTADSKKIFENKLGKEITYMPQEHENQNYVFAHGNVFIETLQQSFDEHRPLLISPDMIWLTICQGVSIHINEKFDSLQTLIFKKDRPKELAVRNDSLENNEKQWADLIASLSQETSKYVNADYYSFFVPKFSTTTPTIKTTYEITLMHSFKKAFNYVGESGCGIPSITLTGNKHDWVTIQSKLSMLTTLGLDDWRIELEPIIVEFINVYDGKINLEFWQNIYKNMSDYNAFYISGWILKFFPYIETRQVTGKWDDEMGGQLAEINYVKNKFLKGDQYLLSTLSTGNFPSGILDVDIQWNNHFKNTTQKMSVYGGFFAIKQHDDKTLEPIISWAICKENANRAAHELTENPWHKIEHKGEMWNPNIVLNVTNKPVFMPSKFDDSDESILHLKSILKDSLTTNFSQVNFSNEKISFVVLSNGHVENVTYFGDENTRIYLDRLIKKYNGDWFPALAMTSEVLKMWKEFVDTDVKIKVNYKVEIEFD